MYIQCRFKTAIRSYPCNKLAQLYASRKVKLAKGDLSNPQTYHQYLEDSDVLVHTVLDFNNPQETDKKLSC